MSSEKYVQIEVYLNRVPQLICSVCFNAIHRIKKLVLNLQKTHQNASRKARTLMCLICGHKYERLFALSQPKRKLIDELTNKLTPQRPRVCRKACSNCSKLVKLAYLQKIRTISPSIQQARKSIFGHRSQCESESITAEVNSELAMETCDLQDAENRFQMNFEQDIKPSAEFLNNYVESPSGILPFPIEVKQENCDAMASDPIAIKVEQDENDIFTQEDKSCSSMVASSENEKRMDDRSCDEIEETQLIKAEKAPGVEESLNQNVATITHEPVEEQAAPLIHVTSLVSKQSAGINVGIDIHFSSINRIKDQIIEQSLQRMATDCKQSTSYQHVAKIKEDIEEVEAHLLDSEDMPNVENWQREKSEEPRNYGVGRKEAPILKTLDNADNSANSGNQIIISNELDEHLTASTDNSTKAKSKPFFCPKCCIMLKFEELPEHFIHCENYGAPNDKVYWQSKCRACENVFRSSLELQKHFNCCPYLKCQPNMNSCTLCKNLCEEIIPKRCEMLPIKMKDIIKDIRKDTKLFCKICHEQFPKSNLKLVHMISHFVEKCKCKPCSFNRKNTSLE